MSDEILESVSCSVCGESMGVFNVDELIVLMLDGIDTVKCFDCEPKESDQVPGPFKSWYVVASSEEQAGNLADVENGLRQFDQSHARAHERTHARGLSSSTYLNRILQDSGVLEFIDRGKHCLTCDGFGEYWYLDNQVTCSACGGIGRIGDKVLLPLWLVNGVRANA